MFFNRVFNLSFAVLLMLTACVPGTSNKLGVSTLSDIENTAMEPVNSSTPITISGKLVIYSGRSEPLIQPVLDAFKTKHPDIEVLLKAGSNSELANALIEEQVNPQADVFITTELFTVQALAQKGVFQPFRPTAAEQIPADFIGPNNTWIGLTQRARVIMYNTDLVKPEDLPTSVFDLTDPKWKGQVAAAGSTNGSMQAQIAAMRQLLGDEDTESWLQGLLDNDVTFFGGHTDVRKAVGTGEFALGLVNHYYFHLQQAEGSKVGMIFPDQGPGQIGLITNATAAAIIKGAANMAAAQVFVDFLVSSEGQQLFADLNYEYPLIPGVILRESVQPLDQYRLVDINVSQATLETDATFALIEKIGMP
ncbi:MAG: ABC transporter substrate-binding protein [Chloroflexi bacterium HGW-Chloroflexi-10]|nr:MAG: ABC transporter substrate-binding protein [Chloroflexi bacterium HGW-Chloroflexi-10]